MPEGFDALPSGGSDFAGLDASSILGSPDDQSSSSSGSSPFSSIKGSLGKLGPIGGVLSGFGTIMEGFQHASEMRTQAKRFDQQAVLDLYQGGQEVKQTQDKAINILGQERAAAGGGGVTASSASLRSDASATITNANTADMASRFAAGVKSASDLYEGKVLKFSAGQTELSGILSGAGTMAMSIGTAAAGMPGGA